MDEVVSRTEAGEDQEGGVLLVDQDAGFVQDLRDLLLAGLRRLRVLTAGSRQEALAVLDRHEVDVVVAGEGFGLADGGMQAGRRVPLGWILLTADQVSGAARKRLRAAGVAIMSRPPPSRAFLELVDGMLHQRLEPTPVSA